MGLKARPGNSQLAMRRKLAVLVPKVFEAECEYERQQGFYDGQTLEEELGAPASEVQLRALEAHLGVALPPSYRAFLSLYNGGSFGFGGGAPILGTEDHKTPHTVSTVQWKSNMFNEFEPVNPLELGAIPFLIGGSRNMILLEPPVRSDGEMDVVEYYLTAEEGRHPSLVAFFEKRLRREDKKAAIETPPHRDSSKEGRNAKEEALFALERCDAERFRKAFHASTDPADLLRLTGDAADRNRTSIQQGRMLLTLADLLLAQPPSSIHRFLPTLVIAAVHAGAVGSRKRAELGASILARLRPRLAQEALEAELVCAWANALTKQGKHREAVGLFDVALDCKRLSPADYCNGLFAVHRAHGTEAQAEESQVRYFLNRCLPMADKNPAIYHNAACVLMDLGDRSAVLDQFRYAIDANYEGLEAMKSDESFLGIRNDSDFAALLRAK